MSQGAGVPSVDGDQAVPVNGASRLLVNGYLTNNESLITPDRQSFPSSSGHVTWEERDNPHWDPDFGSDPGNSPSGYENGKEEYEEDSTESFLSSSGHVTLDLELERRVGGREDPLVNNDNNNTRNNDDGDEVNRNRPDPPSESPVENTPQCAYPIEERPPLASADNASANEIKTVVISTPITLSQRQVTAGDEVGDKTEHGARSNRQDIVVGRDPTPTKEEGVGFLPCNPGSDPDNSQYVCEMGEEEEEDSNTSGELISMSVVIYSLK